MHPDDHKDPDGDQLRRMDLNKSWSWYSEHLVKSGKETLPGKKVGRSGIRPMAEVSLQHIIRSCSRLKARGKQFQKATLYERQPRWNEVVEANKHLNDQIQRYNQDAKTPITVPQDMPEEEASIEVWVTWSRSIKKRGTLGYKRCKRKELQLYGLECRKQSTTGVSR